MSSIITESQHFNNEIPFCTVYSLRDKKELERIFLKHRISYYLDWQKQSLWQKIFGGRKGSDRINCLVKINRADVERARELVKNITGLKMKELIGNTENRQVTKRALMDEEMDLDKEDEEM
ncbi:hypothetical protein [Butyrivibrio sp. NC3005]|uniref:hypothetical protein n=1 Tax=Butyrivibrio sp. NC3005 TaxID=1280685 RepID=UPI000422592E|nr:hypothetical protein [Butyrivibrio sp. NC3005]